MKRDALNTIKGGLLGLFLVGAGATFFAYAWTGPTQAPPNGNVAAPVNVSSSAQTKTGWLGVGGPGSLASQLDVNGKVTIRGGRPADGKVLVSDALGTASWMYVARQNSTNCAWVKPTLTCGVTPSYTGTTCNQGQYVAGVKIGVEQCTPDNIIYTYVYCCNITTD